jgi:hypothetical protein
LFQLAVVLVQANFILALMVVVAVAVVVLAMAVLRQDLELLDKVMLAVYTMPALLAVVAVVQVRQVKIHLPAAQAVSV